MHVHAREADLVIDLVAVLDDEQQQGQRVLWLGPQRGFERECIVPVAAAKAEHRIEQCFQRAKSEAGPADYEVRHWIGWHHHQTLSLITTRYLTVETRRAEKKCPRSRSLHCVAASPRSSAPNSNAIHSPASPPKFNTAYSATNKPGFNTGNAITPYPQKTSNDEDFGTVELVQIQKSSSVREADRNDCSA